MNVGMTDTITVVYRRKKYVFRMDKKELQSGWIERDLVARFLSGTWGFMDCFRVAMFTKCDRTRATDFFKSFGSPENPPAELGVIAGAIVTACVYGVPKDAATIDLDQVKSDG